MKPQRLKVLRRRQRDSIVCLIKDCVSKSWCAGVYLRLSDGMSRLRSLGFHLEEIVEPTVVVGSRQFSLRVKFTGSATCVLYLRART